MNILYENICLILFCTLYHQDEETEIMTQMRITIILFYLIVYFSVKNLSYLIQNAGSDDHDIKVIFHSFD